MFSDWAASGTFKKHLTLVFQKPAAAWIRIFVAEQSRGHAMPKKDLVPPERKSAEPKPEEIPFDFEDLIAAGVTAVVVKRPRNRRSIYKRDSD